MVKRRVNANTRKVEVDVLVKGGRNGNGTRGKRRRNRGGGLQDTARSYGSGYQSQQRNVSVSVPGGMGFTVPRGLSMAQKGDIITIRKCEVFALVQAGPTEEFYVVEDQALIPANIPWLSGVATNFSKWRFKKVAFKYTATVGTTTNGMFGAGFGYDMAESAATSFVQVAAFDQFKAGPLWGSWDQEIVVDTGRFSRDWYPFIGLTVFKGLTGNDQNDYCPAYLATFAGISSLATLGATGIMWVDYEIELVDPIAATLQPN